MQPDQRLVLLRNANPLIKVSMCSVLNSRPLTAHIALFTFHIGNAHRYIANDMRGGWFVRIIRPNQITLYGANSLMCDVR